MDPLGMNQMQNRSRHLPKPLRHLRQRLSCLVGSLLLIGCGGGGDGASEVGQQSPEADQKVWRSFLAGSRSFTVTGFSRNDVTLVEVDLYTYTFRYDPSSAAVFPLTGEPATRLVRHETIAAQSSGPTPFSTTTHEMFFSSDLRLLGTRTTRPGFQPECSLATSRSLFPSDFPAGLALDASGSLAVLQPQSSCGAPYASIGGASELRWVFGFDSGVRFICLRFGAVSNTNSRFAEHCHEINADSTIGSRSRVTLPNIANPLIMRNY